MTALRTPFVEFKKMVLHKTKLFYHSLLTISKAKVEIGLYNLRASRKTDSTTLAIDSMRTRKIHLTVHDKNKIFSKVIAEVGTKVVVADIKAMIDNFITVRTLTEGKVIETRYMHLTQCRCHQRI